uniref:Uncharacterized protein n=1 Tax=Ditylenchus dipsaci TaxID=166011 RepID=A0A915CQS6_9BILA
MDIGRLFKNPGTATYFGSGYMFQLLSSALFIVLIKWLKNVPDERFDAQEVAESRSDAKMLIGAAIVMSMGWSSRSIFTVLAQKNSLERGSFKEDPPAPSSGSSGDWNRRMETKKIARRMEPEERRKKFCPEDGAGGRGEIILGWRPEPEDGDKNQT